jgi:hypothetical protein
MVANTINRVESILEREAARWDQSPPVLPSVIVAERGPFKTLRGQFDDDGLRTMPGLMNRNPGGTACHYKHANMNDADQLGRFLGRFRNPRLSADGSMVLADLHFDKTAFMPPPGGGPPLGQYVWNLAHSDSRALAASLVLKTEKLPARDERGRAAPPIWKPLQIDAVDIVGRGDATSRLLLAAPAHDDAALRARNAARKAAWARAEAQQEAEDIRLRWEWKNKKRRLGL